MSVLVKKVTLLLMLVALMTNAYANSLSASDLTPTCTMEMMMDNDDALTTEMSCDCVADQMQCALCCLNMVGANSFAVLLAEADLLRLDSSNVFIRHRFRLDSVTLSLPSPPPIS